MDIRKLITSGAFFLMVHCSSVAHELDKVTEKQLFQNYALAMCLASEFKGSTVYSDAGLALNGYRESGKLGLSVYSDAYKLLQKWQQKPYVSHSGATMKVARCIDFHYSQDIADLFQKNDPCAQEKNWRDKALFKVRCPSLN